MWKLYLRQVWKRGLNTSLAKDPLLRCFGFSDSKDERALWVSTHSDPAGPRSCLTHLSPPPPRMSRRAEPEELLCRPVPSQTRAQAGVWVPLCPDLGVGIPLCPGRGVGLPCAQAGVWGSSMPRLGQHSRWMSMVTEVSFPAGMALLVARHTMLCPFSTSPGEMNRVLTMLSRLPSRSRVWGEGEKAHVTQWAWPGSYRKREPCARRRAAHDPRAPSLHRAGVSSAPGLAECWAAEEKGTRKRPIASENQPGLAAPG